MKTPATTKVMTSAPNSLDSKPVSRYRAKCLNAAHSLIANSGYTLTEQNGSLLLINAWGLKKAVESIDAAIMFVGVAK